MAGLAAGCATSGKGDSPAIQRDGTKYGFNADLSRAMQNNEALVYLRLAWPDLSRNARP